jgi:hypothetical protein
MMTQEATFSGYIAHDATMDFVHQYVSNTMRIAMMYLQFSGKVDSTESVLAPVWVLEFLSSIAACLGKGSAMLSGLTINRGIDGEPGGS